jgi:hypothetical protein
MKMTTKQQQMKPAPKLQTPDPKKQVAKATLVIRELSEAEQLSVVGGGAVVLRKCNT